MASTTPFSTIASQVFLDEFSQHADTYTKFSVWAEKLGIPSPQLDRILELRYPESKTKHVLKIFKEESGTVEHFVRSLEEVNYKQGLEIVKKYLKEKKIYPQAENNNNLHPDHQTANPIPSYLQPFVAGRELCDLHTHLLGMGDSNFWINEIILKKIPEYSKQTRILFVPHEKNPDLVPQRIVIDSNFAAVEFCKTYPKLVTPQEAIDKIGEYTFTTDVVYSLDALSCALLGQKYDNQNKTKDKLNACLGGIWDFVKKYIVFNQCDQTFELYQGLANNDLIWILKKNPQSIQELKIAFEFKEGNRTQDSIANFTPMFYPRKYKLKDFLYKQHLKVYKDLLVFVLKQYAQWGVGYAELSVSANDLSKPWVFENLVDVDEGLPKYKFLAAFNRNTNFVWNPTETTEDIKAAKDILENKAKYMQMFPKSFETLEKLKTAINTPGSKLARWVVGIDWVGDEYNQPYCVFDHSDFLEFVKDRREKSYGEFGIRFHCLEYLRTEGIPNLVHIGIASEVVTNILHFFVDDKYPIPVLRIGHGIFFNQSLYDPTDLPDEDILLCLSVRKRIIKARELLVKKKIAFEINLTSNWYLVPEDLKNLIPTIYPKFNAILATDNEGIWEIKHGHCSSVAGEICYAVELEIINIERVSEIVANTKAACFSNWK